MPLNVIATSLERTSKQNIKQINNKGEEKSRKEKKRIKVPSKTKLGQSTK